MSNASLYHSTLTNASLAGATVAGANFGSTNLTTSQLYSTASYQDKNLQGIRLWYTNLPGADFSGQNMTGALLTAGTLTGASFKSANLSSAYFSYANLTGANFASANLSSGTLASANLSNADLSNANLSSGSLTYATLTNANLAGANIAGADFSNTTLTSSQFYSTASYQSGSLHGIGLGGVNMAGWNFSGLDLSNANLTGANLTGANLSNADLNGAILDGNLTNADITGASVAGAAFGTSNLTASQLYSTASYKARYLAGMDFSNDDLTGWNLAGQNLTNSVFQSSTFNGANLNAADLRGAYDPDGNGTFYGYGASLVNAIDENGTIQGLNLSGTNLSLTIHDYSAPAPIPIHVSGGMAVAIGGTLQMVFDGPNWGSTISFDPGIPVTLGGVLQLNLAVGLNPTGLLGQSLPLFDWTGVSPTGQFASIASNLPTRYTWDASALYFLGQIDLTVSGSALAGQWAANGGGTWSSAADWSGGNVPGAPQDTALFGLALSGGTATVTLDSVVSLASLTFSPSGGASYVIIPAVSLGGVAYSPSAGGAWIITPASSNYLVLSSTAALAAINNAAGDNTIAAPINLESNLSVSTTTSSILTIDGDVSESGGSRSLTLTGGGELVLSGSNSYSGGTIVEAGTLIVTNNEGLADGSSLTVGDPALLALFGSVLPADRAGAEANSAERPLAGPGTTNAVPEPSALILLAAAAVAPTRKAHSSEAGGALTRAPLLHSILMPLELAGIAVSYNCLWQFRLPKTRDRAIKLFHT